MNFRTSKFFFAFPPPATTFEAACAFMWTLYFRAYCGRDLYRIVFADGDHAVLVTGGGGTGGGRGYVEKTPTIFKSQKRDATTTKILGPLLKQPLQFVICRENPFLKVNSIGALVRVKILARTTVRVRRRINTGLRDIGRKSCSIRVNEALNTVQSVKGLF